MVLDEMKALMFWVSSVPLRSHIAKSPRCHSLASGNLRPSESDFQPVRLPFLTNHLPFLRNRLKGSISILGGARHHLLLCPKRWKSLSKYAIDIGPFAEHDLVLRWYDATYNIIGKVDCEGDLFQTKDIIPWAASSTCGLVTSALIM